MWSSPSTENSQFSAFVSIVQVPERRKMMTRLKQLWLVLMLAIAGAGPLPLWLHQWQCHSHQTADESVDQHAGHTASPHVHSPHVHSPQNHHVLKNGQLVRCSHPHPGSARPAALPEQGVVNSAPHTHDECALCYFLSQASSSASVEASCFGGDLIASLNQELPSIALAKGIDAYSSRAPPAV